MKVYATATGWITHPDRPEAEGVELFEHALDGDEMPCQMGVNCDECDVTVMGDYVVRESMTSAKRLEIARTHLRTQGWSCDTEGDFCPGCKAQR